MAPVDDVKRALRRRVLDGDVPEPVFALFGLVDRVATDTDEARSRITGGAGSLVSGITALPGAVWSAATSEYSALVHRGQTRSVELAAERAVRKRVSRFEDQIAPRAARTTVLVNERRKRWAASRARQRAEEARRRARQAGERFAELNAPVLAEPVQGVRADGVSTARPPAP